MILILNLCRRRVAAEVAADTEVLPCMPWVRVPGFKAWICGVATHKSNLLPIVDLSALLDAQPLTGRADKQRIISVGAGGFRTGFLVASVDQAGLEGGEDSTHENLESIQLNELCLGVLADPARAVVGL